MRQIRFRSLLIISLFLLVQSGMGQTDSLNISWDRNPTEDSVAYYILFRAESNDDTSFSSNEYDSILTVPQTSPSVARVAAVDHSHPILSGFFISYKVVAVDEQGLQSDFSDQEGVGIPQINWIRTVLDSGQTASVPLTEFLQDLDDPVSQLDLVSTQATNIQVVRSSNNLNITPNPISYSGPASFVLTATDPEGFWDRKVINLSIVASGSPNERPKAENDQVTTRQGIAEIINPLINDSDPDGDPIILSTTFPVLPQHGTLESLGDSILRYTPDDDYQGLDNFDYQISDGRGASDTATVSITVLAVETIGENTIAFPNPVKVSDGQTTIVFEPIPADAQELWLISPALGNIVYKKIFSGAPPSRLELSLLDDDLKKLSSGFYIYLIKGKGDKKLESGKIAIIR